MLNIQPKIQGNQMDQKLSVRNYRLREFLGRSQSTNNSGLHFRKYWKANHRQRFLQFPENRTISGVILKFSKISQREFCSWSFIVEFPEFSVKWFPIRIFGTFKVSSGMISWMKSALVSEIVCFSGDSICHWKFQEFSQTRRFDRMERVPGHVLFFVLHLIGREKSCTVFVAIGQTRNESCNLSQWPSLGKKQRKGG